MSKKSVSFFILAGLAFGFLSVEVAAAPQPPVDPQTLRLKTVGAFDPRVDIPGHSGLPTVQAYAPGVRGAYLVQFDHPIIALDRRSLEYAGASIKGYVPMMALEVVMTAAQRDAVEAIPGVRWVGVYQPSFKVQADLVQRAAAHGAGTMKLQVSLFPGEAGALTGLRGLGAQVLQVEPGRSLDLAVVEIPAGRLTALAQQPLVRFIEPVYQRKELNDRSREHTGLTAIADDTFTNGIDPSLSGTDGSFQVKYGHFDGGLEPDHDDFMTANVTVETGFDISNDAHGTHTAGSIVGDGRSWNTVPQVPPGSESPDDSYDYKWRGVTPEAALHHIPFSSNYSDRQVFEREVEEGAHISSNSWGYCTPRGPFMCPSITDYNSNAAVWDEGVWDADDDQSGQQPLIVFFSAGNSGNGNSDGCGTSSGDQVGTPGTAKNVITVGANETDRGCGVDGDNVGDMTYFSSRGPVDPDGSGRGLAKPDVTNIGGLWVLSVEADSTGGSGVDTTNPGSSLFCSDTGSEYRYEAGTSMSNPLTAGLGGVVLQDLVVNQNVASPKPSLIKALLINGAVSLTPSGSCSYSFDVSSSSISQGWGLVNAPNSLYGPGGSPSQRNIAFENEITGNAVGTGEAHSFTVDLQAGTPFKVTLVWTDFPASAGSGSPLVVNDLDLEVSGPDGTFLGNNFVGTWSVTGGSPDRYNVVENVYIENPADETYTITVKGFQVSQDQEPGKSGINQDFSLVWSGAFGQAEPVTDIAISAVSAPSSAVQGDLVSVDVTVANVGNQDVTTDITVTLTDDTDAVTIGSQVISDGLAAGASTIVSFNWDTTGASTGDHTLSASHNVADDNAANDSNSTVVSVQAAVTDIAISSVSAPSSATQGDLVTVDVTVENVGNQDVTGDITVSLTESPDGTSFTDRTILGGLAAGASTVVSFDWDTTGASIGDHTLAASHNFADDDLSNDSLSTVVTVNEPTAGVEVTGIDPSSMQAGTTIDVTISGSGFASGAAVTFENGSGPSPSASNVQVAADGNSLTATVTAKSGGPPRNRVWDVVVTNSDGSSGVLAGSFTVTP